MARAKHLVLFHHDPALDDEALVAMQEETRRFEAITRRTPAADFVGS